ncbi:polyketide synthase Pks13 [Hoyosella sp. YIM 151337]|uniref:polyketide synthase Pks13 n=1 Tax=Hoyosella sp. YIM 151337 TaxID=2992742 RepID=UPI00223544D6|nr:polyketide synthase Pks13 [Hoyosella sp. YIM 151337]MCW4354620.1 polyketide synthase Pks13 [Hoyosella sp. YIM 151337]
MTVAQLTDWLRDWVAASAGLPREQVSADRPMEEFGLSSRDAVALSGEIEELLGIALSATIAYENPTIAALAKRIIDGPEETAASDAAAEALDRPAPATHADIAIVGIAARFPGGVSTPEDMWNLLAEGRDAISELPAGRWDEYAGDPVIAAAMASTPTLGGYLDDVKGFDHEFFGMSPLEAENVDPQQRLALELAWEALENAYIPASELRGKQVGVFIGSSTNDYSLLTASDPSTAHYYALTGTASSVIPNRVSYTFDFRGPSISVDTACSSSLVAVHQAVQSLRTGESEIALAGGVNMLLSPAATLGFGAAGVLAPDGRIKAFSKDADGIARGEGGGLLVLKRLDDAVGAGDTVLAVIKGSAVNSDGRSNGLTAPNPDAQVAVLRAAYRDAGIDPATVDYIEAHGTGTLLGDPIEAEALHRVLGKGRDALLPTLLGSAKTNFGHLESAAGAAGLIKVILSMQHDLLPATINFAGPNPYIPFDEAKLEVVDDIREWPRYSGTATAGVSGFGFGGTNAHVVVQEYTPPADEQAHPLPAPEALFAAGPYIFPVSAGVPSRRRLAARQLAEWLETGEGQQASLDAVARTLAKRNHGRSRAAVVASTRADLVAGLQAIAAGKPGPGVFSANAPAANAPVWVFSGFGSQFRGMGRALYEAVPVFAAHVDEIDALMIDESGHSIKELFFDDDVRYGVELAQLGIFTIQVALGATLRYYGAQPGAVLGHSVGEVAAAAVSGGLPLDDAVRVICARARLMGEAEAGLSGDDIRRMAIVEFSADELAAMRDQYPGIEICVYAAPTQTVIGGPDAEVRAIVDMAEAQQKLGRILETKGAGHTEQMDPILGELAAELGGIDARPPECAVFSSVHEGKKFARRSAPLHAEDYWTKNVRRTVWFTHAVNNAVADGYSTFVELAPHPIALMSVAATTFAAGLHEPQLVYTQNRKEDAAATLMGAIAQLYVYGHAVDLARVAGPGELTAPPATPWIKRPHWTQARAASGGGTQRVPGAHVSLPDGQHAWEVQAQAVSDLDSLVLGAAGQVLSDVHLGAVIYHGQLPDKGSLTTMLHPHPGGASLRVYAQSGDGFALIADAVVTAGGPLNAPEASNPSVAASAAAAPASAVSRNADDTADGSTRNGDKWDPESGEPATERLTRIVAEAMGYAPEDLPPEIPLIELGLDSLMAVRIKNRVEYEFSIPQVQVQVLRNASLNDVEKYVTFALENPDQVEELAQQQQAERAATTGQGPSVPSVPSGATEPAPAPADAVAANAADALDQRSVTESAGLEVPPRDAAERLVFAQWATVTGVSAGGIFSPLPAISAASAAALAEKLSERTGGTITVDDVRSASTIEKLADVVREHLEGDVGLVRTLRARTEGSDRVPVFVFHPAGGSTVVYEPLTKRLPADVPVYGFERVEGKLSDRVAEYLPALRDIQPHGPYVLVGWSFGGALAYAMAQRLRAEGEDVALLGLLDTVFPSEPIPDTPEEIALRWQRFNDFAAVNYGFQFPLPIDELVKRDDQGQIQLLLGMLKDADHTISGGIIEHQRASFLDNRAVQMLQPDPYAGPVVLYKAERMHDGAVQLEPRFGNIAADGGWGDVAPDLEIVQVTGDHLGVVDEPVIARVAAHLAGRLEQIEVKRRSA